jgi:hypothetical protein
MRGPDCPPSDDARESAQSLVNPAIAIRRSQDDKLFDYFDTYGSAEKIVSDNLKVGGNPQSRRVSVRRAPAIAD